MQRPNKKVFISYSHSDIEYFQVFKKGLENHLFTSHKYDFGSWDDSKIYEGSFWDDEIQHNLSECNIALLCVSANFLNSKYIEAKEFGVLIDKFPNVLIVPIYFNHCNINAWTELSKRQFFKPSGERYDKGVKDDFSFCDLINFRSTDGKAIPNSNVDLYLKDFVNRLEKNLDEGAKIEKKTEIDYPKSLSIVPKSTSKFIGRANELKEFEEIFTNENIISVEGLGGVGKTEFIAKFFEKFDQSKIVWFEGKDNATFESFIELSGFRDLLKIENNSELAIFLGFRDLLEKNEKIVIVDNFQDLTDLRFQLFFKLIKNSFKNCKVILISRGRLFIEGVDLVHYLVEGLTSDSLEFAKSIIKKNQIKEIYIDEEKLLRICEELNGHPFGIQIAVQLLSYEESDISILEIIKEYRDEKERLSNRLLNEVFNHPRSTKEEKELLLQLSVYRKNFSVASIQYSYGVNFREPLRNLIDKFLVEKKEAHYSIHSLAREFAYEKLIDSSSAHVKAANYYLESNDINELSDFEDLFFHLERAGEIGIMKDFIEGRGEEMLDLGYSRLLQTKINFVIEKGGESVILYNLLSDLAIVNDSNMKLSIAYAEKALSLKSDNIHAKLEAKIAFNEGILRMGGLEKPFEVFKELLVECEENQFIKGQSICMSYVGKFLTQKGRIIDGERMLKMACEKSNELNYGAGIRHCNLFLADYYSENNRYKEALNCFEFIYKHFSQFKNDRGKYIALNGIAVVYSNINKLEKSLNIFKECLEFYTEIGDKRYEATSLFNIGATLRQIDNGTPYIEYFNRALQIEEELEDYSGIAKCLEFFAEESIFEKDYLQALKHFFGCFLNYKKVALLFDIRRKCLFIKESIGIGKYEIIYNQALESLNSNEISTIENENLSFKPLREAGGYKRNDYVKVQYNDGVIKEIKFKKIEEDLTNGACRIIE